MFEVDGYFVIYRELVARFVMVRLLFVGKLDARVLILMLCIKVVVVVGLWGRWLVLLLGYGFDGLSFTL